VDLLIMRWLVAKANLTTALQNEKEARAAVGHESSSSDACTGGNPAWYVLDDHLYRVTFMGNREYEIFVCRATVVSCGAIEKHPAVTAWEAEHADGK
jgi:hypothetical protein